MLMFSPSVGGNVCRCRPRRPFRWPANRRSCRRVNHATAENLAVAVRLVNRQTVQLFLFVAVVP
jgi:hypothetical protein